LVSFALAFLAMKPAAWLWIREDSVVDAAVWSFVRSLNAAKEDRFVGVFPNGRILIVPGQNAAAAPIARGFCLMLGAMALRMIVRLVLAGDDDIRIEPILFLWLHSFVPGSGASFG